MPPDRNLRDSPLHVFGTLDYSRQPRIARHNAPEDIVENALDLTVDQVAVLKLIKAVCLLQLPGAWPTDNDDRLIFLYDRTSNSLETHGRVKLHQFFTVEFTVSLTRV